MATLKQQRFALEIAMDDGRSGTACAIAAGYTEVSAATMASENLRIPEVIKLIEKRRADLAAVAGVDRAWVFKQLVAIASVDHRKISQTRIGCCRHCYGIDHLYQWTRGEYSKAAADALQNGKDAPELLGGLGFNLTLPPIADCPECGGEGRERVWVADSRNLDDDTAIAYLGTKRTKDGAEVNKADKMKAIELLGRAVGMWNDKLAVSAPGGGPIQHAHVHAMVATDVRELSEDELESFIRKKMEEEKLGVLEGVVIESPRLTDGNDED